MFLRGECLACSRLGRCQETDYQKIYWGHTCALFEAVPEPEYLARTDMMSKFGEQSTINALLDRPQDEGENDGR